MHKMSMKRQVTVPKSLCDKVGIQPGDMVEVFEYEGHITVMKQQYGVSEGRLKYLKGNKSISDKDSLRDALRRKRKT